MTTTRMKLAVLLGMVAVGAMSVLADGGTEAIAFYGFKDAAPGTDATTVTLVNAVDASQYAGTVTTFGTAETESAATFSDDAPGAYIYSSSRRGAKIICEHPQSIHLSAVKNSTGCGGTIAFADIATELSKHHDTGFTVEFYFKAVEGSDPYYPYSSTLQANCGYTKVSGGALTSFNIYAPCDSISKLRYGFGGYGSSYPGNSAGSKNLTKIHDGKWHRLALIETAPDETGAQKIMFYVDGSRNIDLTIPAADITLTERTDSVAYSLGLDHLCGKYACVRMTSRALETDELMTIGGRAPVAMPEGTVAFYPFDEGVPGESAVGETVFNVLDPLCEKGTVTLGTKTGAAVTFDADAPAKYIFDGDAYKATVVYTNPASLKFTSEEDGGSGSVSFAGLGALTSRYHENGHTVEYFLKMDDDAFAGYGASLVAVCGYVEKEGSAAGGLNLYMPFAKTYSSGREFRYALTSYSGHTTTSSVLGYNLWNTGWHHVALVERKTVTPATGELPETTNTALSVYVDYAQRGSLSIYGTTLLTGSQAISLCNSCHHGKYSCLRVTDHALEPNEFLHASNCETYWPKTAYRWTFDGTAGETVGVESNAAPSFAELNPGLYISRDAFSGDSKSSAGVRARPTRPRLALVDEGDGEAASRTNAACAKLFSDPGSDSGFRYGPTIETTLDKNARLQEGDFTVEGFFRFAQRDWVETAASYPKGRPRLSIWSCLYYSSPAIDYWDLSLHSLTSSQHLFRLTARTVTDAESQTVGSVSVSSPTGDYLNDEKPHHLAVTYEEKTCRLVLYYDYRPILTNQLRSAIAWDSHSPALSIGNGPTLSNNMFHGFVDEVRYTRECLTPDEFVRLDPIPVGFLLLFR